MKQFKSNSLIILFYEIVGWCIANKQLPRKLDIWIEDKDKGVFVANVYYYPDETKLKEPKKEQENTAYTEAETNKAARQIRTENKEKIAAERINDRKSKIMR